VIVEVLDVQRDELPAQERGRLVGGRRFEAPGQSRGDQRGGRRVRAGQVVLGGAGVGGHLAGLGREQEADGKQHDLGHPPGSAGDQQRRGADLGQRGLVWAPQPGPASQPGGSAQVAEGELGAGHEELGVVGAGRRGTHVPAGEQPAVLKQVQPVQRREPAAPALAGQGGGRSPEHREPLVERRSSGFHGAGDSSDGDAVLHRDRVPQDEPQVDVADQRAEAAMGQAAQRVPGDQACAQGVPVGRYGPSQDGLARIGIGQLPPPLRALTGAYGKGH
jgi:hypothetical protein